MDKLTLQSIILSRDIQAFNDEIADFSRDCAFLSDEFCELVESKTQQPDNTTAGLAIFSQWVKSRTHKLSQDMRKIKSKPINILSQCTDQNKN
jgi:hypothetical protein